MPMLVSARPIYHCSTPGIGILLPSLLLRTEKRPTDVLDHFRTLSMAGWLTCFQKRVQPSSLTAFQKK
jgi:hypothetical protein